MCLSLEIQNDCTEAAHAYGLCLTDAFFFFFLSLKNEYGKSQGSSLFAWGGEGWGAGGQGQSLVLPVCSRKCETGWNLLNHEPCVPPEVERAQWPPTDGHSSVSCCSSPKSQRSCIPPDFSFSVMFSSWGVVLIRKLLAKFLLTSAGLRLLAKNLFILWCFSPPCWLLLLSLASSHHWLCFFLSYSHTNVTLLSRMTKERVAVKADDSFLLKGLLSKALCDPLVLLGLPWNLLSHGDTRGWAGGRAVGPNLGLFEQAVPRLNWKPPGGS